MNGDEVTLLGLWWDFNLQPTETEIS